VLFVVLIASALKLLGAATAHVVFASLTLALVFGVRLAIGSTRRAAEQA
jgi:hypothetical protein